MKYLRLAGQFVVIVGLFAAVATFAEAAFLLAVGGDARRAVVRRKDHQRPLLQFQLLLPI